jgi:hypothetical protein
MDLGDAEGTVALRVPDHELARDILRATGPMAVSSANISGLPAALTCDEAIDQLGASVSVYLDGGRLGENGQPPSTIVDFTQADHGQVLRRGALSVEVLRETLPDVEDLVDDEDPTGEEPTDEEPTDEEATGDGTTGDEPGEPDDVVDAEIVEEPDAEPGEESAADIRTQIENAEPETEAEPESASEPAPDSEPSPEVWHEPTTDELRITHPDHDIDQPDLFDSEQPDSEQPDSEQESPGDAPDSAGSRV